MHENYMPQDSSPQFISEEELKSIDLEELQAFESTLKNKLMTTRGLNAMAKAGKFILGGVAAFNIVSTVQTPDTMHFSSSGAALVVTAAGYLIQKNLDNKETVLNFNFASTEFEIERRIKQNREE